MELILPEKKLYVPPKRKIIRPDKEVRQAMAHRQGILINRTIASNNVVPPSGLPNQVSWHRADFGLTPLGGGPPNLIQGTWTDKTGNGHNAVFYVGNEPYLETAQVNGFDSVRFHPTAYATVPTHANYEVNNFTIYLVMQLLVAPTGGFETYLMKVSNSGWNDGWGFANPGLVGQVGFFTNNYVFGAFTPMNTSLHLVTCIYDGTDLSIYFDGVLAATHVDGLPDYTTPADLVLNGYWATGGGTIALPGGDWRVCEWSFFNAAHGPTDITNYHAYSVARYASP